MKKANLSELLEAEVDFKFLGSFVGTEVDTRKIFVCTSDMRRSNRFFYITDGTFYITPKGESEETVGRGEFIFLPEGIEYKSRWDGARCGYYCIYFDLRENGEKYDLGNELLFVEKDETGSYLTRFREIHKTWKDGRLGYRLKCTAELIELVRFLAINNLKDGVSKSCQPILRGIMYLEDNYTEDVTTEELAEMCNMSTSNFRRLFQHYSEYPPITYRNVLRIKKAAQLLKTNDYTVGEVAEEVNINDLYYFSKMFKKIIGVSPKKYMTV